MKRKAAFLFAAFALASGCATTGASSKYINQLTHFSELRVGMPQAEVLKVMGPPLKAETHKARDGHSFLEWQYCATHEATSTSEFVWLVFEDQSPTAGLL